MEEGYSPPSSTNFDNPERSHMNHISYELYQAIIDAIQENSAYYVDFNTPLRKFLKSDRHTEEAYECIPKKAKSLFEKRYFLVPLEKDITFKEIADAKNTNVNYVRVLFKQAYEAFWSYMDRLGYSQWRTVYIEHSFGTFDDEDIFEVSAEPEEPTTRSTHMPQMSFSAKITAGNYHNLTNKEPANKDLSSSELYSLVKLRCLESDIPSKLITAITLSAYEYIRTGTMKPLLLAGIPGIGKTHLAYVISEILGLPLFTISAPDASSGDGLTGFSDSYKCARPGAIVASALQNQVLNSVILIDEVDKARDNDSNHPIRAELASALDGTHRIRDLYLNEDISTKNIPFILTANDLELVPEFLKDRCTVIKFPEPDKDRIISIVGKYATQELMNPFYESKLTFDDEAFRTAVSAMMARGVKSLRKYRTVVDTAFQLAFVELIENQTNKNEITKRHFSQAIEEATLNYESRMGFSL